MLALYKIRIDGGTQARVKLNQDLVTEYAEHMKDGDKFPPITVFNDGSDHWLADGFHRFFAYKANNETMVEVEVINGTLEDATLYAFAANAKRGLSMSDEDNRNVITLMLKHPKWSLWSDREISRHVGVSNMTVGRVKQSLNLPKEDVVKFTRQGKELEMKTGNIKRAERPVGTKPDLSTINEDKIAIDNLNDQISGLSDTINELSNENTILKDKIAIGQWDATDMEKMDAEETIKDLREQVRVLEIENRALREGRDMYQNRNAELMATVKSLQAKLKK
jgi:predicted  nucleic acid-binding Zn-ribbon protein